MRSCEPGRIRRAVVPRLVACVAALIVTACGAPPPVAPTPNPGGGGGGGAQQPPPVNTPPTVDLMTIQGTRANQPANFADLGETVAVSAKVSDPETALDQLQYAWTASTGTVNGTGASVTWQAPAVGPAIMPADVILTLTVTERYGHPGGALSFEQSVSKTATLSLHDSVKEVGQMSRQFLLDFSDTDIKDADYIMRNFGTPAFCPEPGEVASERDDVTRNFREYRMTNFLIGPAATTIGFGGRCPVFSSRGDACASAPVFWDSVEVATGKRSVSSGNSIIAASYSRVEKRWWLCASRYQVLTTAGVLRSIR